MVVVGGVLTVGCNSSQVHCCLAGWSRVLVEYLTSLDLILLCCQVREGLYYNPYFPGGALAMPRMLADGGVEYDDGTPSNSSQQAKVMDCFDFQTFTT
jgi:cytochrome c1